MKRYIGHAFSDIFRIVVVALVVLSGISYSVHAQDPNISLKSLTVSPGSPVIVFSPEWYNCLPPFQGLS